MLLMVCLYPSELRFQALGPIATIGSGTGTIGGGGGNMSLNGSGNALSYINISDIESISILKDADATAIYGSQAAKWCNLDYNEESKGRQDKV